MQSLIEGLLKYDLDVYDVNTYKLELYKKTLKQYKICTYVAEISTFIDDLDCDVIDSDDLSVKAEMPTVTTVDFKKITMPEDDIYYACINNFIKYPNLEIKLINEDVVNECEKLFRRKMYKFNTELDVYYFVPMCIINNNVVYRCWNTKSASNDSAHAFIIKPLGVDFNTSPSNVIKESILCEVEKYYMLQSQATNLDFEECIVNKLVTFYAVLDLYNDAN